MPWSPALLTLLVPWALAGEEAAKQPEPGPVPTSILRLGELSVPSVRGEPEDALATFLDGHEAHRKGDLDRALKGYLAFLGMESRAALPPRYERTARERLDRMLSSIRERYDKALALYAKDRQRGLSEARELAGRYPMLPEGRAALALAHTDAIHAAITEARSRAQGGDRKAAAALLEKAVRACPAALYRYQAKSLLLELGGPDLFEPGERVGDAGDGPEPREKKRDEGETSIEIGDR